MTANFWTPLRRVAAVGGVALLLAAGSARADDAADLADIRAEIEKLKKQNDYLLRIVESGGLRQASVDAAGQVDRKELEKAVTDILKAEDEKKKKKEADDKKKKDEEGFVVGADQKLAASWNNGLYFESADKAFSVRVRGRVNNDWGWVTADPEVTEGAPANPPLGLPAEGGIGTLEDGTFFRRARLGVEGKIYEVFNYVAEFDFADGANIAFREVWMGVSQLPMVGNARAGHYKEYFSLEQLTSSRFITFIERSIIDDAFVPAYNTGISAYNTMFEDDRGTWAIGFFRPTVDNGGTSDGISDGEYAGTGRVTILPYWEHDGRCLLHIGGAASYRDLDNGVYAFRSRPYRVPPVRNFVGMPTANGEHQWLFGAEAALVLGPLSIQGEYIYTTVTDVFTGATPATLRDFGDTDYYGYYVYATYFLTGEHRVYRKATGAFDRVRPHENFFMVKTGADGCGSICSDWNPNMKVMFNYELLDVDRAATRTDGDVQTFVMRFAWDF